MAQVKTSNDIKSYLLGGRQVVGRVLAVLGGRQVVGCVLGVLGGPHANCLYPFPIPGKCRKCKNIARNTDIILLKYTNVCYIPHLYMQVYIPSVLSFAFAALADKIEAH